MTTEPKNKSFSQHIEEVQENLLWIGLSLAAMVILLNLSYAENIFKPDYVKLLSALKAIISTIAVVFVGLSGKSLLKGKIKSIKYGNFEMEFKSDSKGISENGTEDK